MREKILLFWGIVNFIFMILEVLAGTQLWIAFVNLIVGALCFALWMSINGKTFRL